MMMSLAIAALICDQRIGAEKRGERGGRKGGEDTDDNYTGDDSDGRRDDIKK